MQVEQLGMNLSGAFTDKRWRELEALTRKNGRLQLWNGEEIAVHHIQFDGKGISPIEVIEAAAKAWAIHPECRVKSSHQSIHFLLPYSVVSKKEAKAFNFIKDFKAEQEALKLSSGENGSEQ